MVLASVSAALRCFPQACWGDGSHFRPAVIRRTEPIFSAAVIDVFVLAVQNRELLPRERPFSYI